MPPRSKLWPIDEQTHGKHIVLRAYLNAWLPILGMTQDRILFIDGFAGPGEYEQGEIGSPIIALQAFESHRARDRMRELVFWFLEEDPERAEHLRGLVTPFEERLPQGKAILIVETGNCQAKLNTLLDQLEAARGRLAPAFVMLDPFGVSDTPMSLVGRILRAPMAELYLSFMWEWINRFKGRPEFGPHLDGLFGTDEWRKVFDLPKEAQKGFLYSIYDRQLRAAGATYVTWFELYNGNRHVYTIFFATKHPKGMDMMKQAIWKADRTGGYAFHGRTGEQLEIDIAEQVDLAGFKNEIREAFGGRGWVTIEDLQEWARTDATDYHSGQVKRALREMEDVGLVDAESGTEKKRRARQFPEKTRIRIKPRA